MKTTTALKSTAVVSGAVVAGLLAVGGTWALWNATAPAGAGTLTSADFRIELTGSDSSPMTLPDGTRATVTMASPAEPLLPGGAAVFAVDVTNATNASAPLALQASLGEPSRASGSAGLEEALDLATGPSRSGSCSTADWSAAATAEIPQGDTAQFCLRAVLDPDAPASLSQRSLTVRLSLAAEQLPAAR